MSDKTLLIGDIGGTNARFALANSERLGIGNETTLKCADFPTSSAAIRHYLDSVSVQSPQVICLAAAGPLIDDSINVTNNHWAMSANEIANDFETDSVRLLNDFDAIARSIPYLDEGDCQPIGPLEEHLLSNERFNVAILGPGTGLGVAGLARRGSLLVPIVGEGGHVGFAPETELQIEILKVLRDRFERVTVEKLISGPGIENLYSALAVVRGIDAAERLAADIFAGANDGSDPLAAAATKSFFEILGQVAGDLALTMGAENGVYIAGGIAKRYPHLLQASRFREAFDSKAHYRAYMKRIPTRLITHEEPGLLGAASCALEQALRIA